MQDTAASNYTDDDVYKIVYCSRNSLGGPEQSAEGLRSILTLARENNKQHNVSGALLFNSGVFAQVLEGKQADVEEIYEHIARDTRHRDITVLQSSLHGPRDFADWSMAYAGTVADSALPLMLSTLNAAFTRGNSNGEAVLSLLQKVVVRTSNL